LPYLLRGESTPKGRKKRRFFLKSRLDKRGKIYTDFDNGPDHQIPVVRDAPKEGKDW